MKGVLVHKTGNYDLWISFSILWFGCDFGVIRVFSFLSDCVEKDLIGIHPNIFVTQGGPEVLKFGDLDKPKPNPDEILIKVCLSISLRHF